MGMRREPGCHVRSRPRRQLRDDPYLRIGGEDLLHLGGEAGTGGQAFAAFDGRIRRQQARPGRAADALGEQRQGGERLCYGVDVISRQHDQIGQQGWIGSEAAQDRVDRLIMVADEDIAWSLAEREDLTHAQAVALVSRVEQSAGRLAERGPRPTPAS
ncbi:hypothetical protein ACIBIZ_38910 [Nonomuraea spiralis]|uniref:hypothetical protein n=1 Tax=Nonomuraea spiralis TaxID=46182 RepID=UPI00378BB423